MDKKQTFIEEITHYLKDFLSIRENSDAEQTVQSIREDISFKGHTAWILVCSIVIASLGLNANSTAVIIGAMLISPLMGPILGMSLSLAANDIPLLKKSGKNFLIMVFLSVFSAFAFFRVFPVRHATSELLARTSPDIRDVLIAFFGGLALVIAKTKKGTIESVIFGVAIATALMPPLCTVGFFLATGQYSLAGGALYLFLINTIYIGIAAYLVLRLVEVPVMDSYSQNPKRRMTIRAIYLCALLTMAPAGYTFYRVFMESKFKHEANLFIENNVETYKIEGSGKLVKDLSKAQYNNGKPYIELVFFGEANISNEVKELWRSQKNTYPSLREAHLSIISDKTNHQGDNKYITELYNNNKQELQSSQREINMLRQEIWQVSKLVKYNGEFDKITKEIKINYPSVKSVAVSNQIITNFEKTDTIALWTIEWEKNIREGDKKEMSERILKWMQKRLDEGVEVKWK